MKVTIKNVPANVIAEIIEQMVNDDHYYQNLLYSNVRGRNGCYQDDTLTEWVTCRGNTTTVYHDGTIVYKGARHAVYHYLSRIDLRELPYEMESFSSAPGWECGVECDPDKVEAMKIVENKRRDEEAITWYKRGADDRIYTANTIEQLYPRVEGRLNRPALQRERERLVAEMAEICARRLREYYRGIVPPRETAIDRFADRVCGVKR